MILLLRKTHLVAEFAKSLWKTNFRIFVDSEKSHACLSTPESWKIAMKILHWFFWCLYKSLRRLCVVLHTTTNTIWKSRALLSLVRIQASKDQDGPFNICVKCPSERLYYEVWMQISHHRKNMTDWKLFMKWWKILLAFMQKKV